MMARGDAGSGTVVKLVSVRSNNGERGLPNVQALVAWLDGPTGEPRVLMDGTALTSLRTGAASAAATDLLAAPDASVLAVVGAGGQAADQIRGVSAVRSLDEVRIVSRSGATALALAEALAAELSATRLRAVPTVAEAVAGADVVCCATNSSTPVLSRGMLHDRVHVNAIGSYRPDMCELASDVLECASMVVVDAREAATSEAGEIIAAIASGAIVDADVLELGDLLIDPPRNVSGLTVFKSVGIAVQDWALAELVAGRLSPSDGPVAPAVEAVNG
jgi:ornithine cyclodeaminase